MTYSALITAFRAEIGANAPSEADLRTLLGWPAEGGEVAHTFTQTVSWQYRDRNHCTDQREYRKLEWKYGGNGFSNVLMTNGNFGYILQTEGFFGGYEGEQFKLNPHLMEIIDLITNEVGGALLEAPPDYKAKCGTLAADESVQPQHVYIDAPGEPRIGDGFTVKHTTGVLATYKLKYNGLVYNLSYRRGLPAPGNEDKFDNWSINVTKHEQN